MGNDPWIERLTSSEPDRSDAIEELCALLRRGLNRSLNDRYGRPFLADDVVQDALMKILSSLDQFEGRSHFIVWAMTIATRVGISALRRKYSSDVSLNALEAEDGGGLKIDLTDTRAVNVSQLADRRDVLVELQRLIDIELTAKQRLAIRAMLEEVAVDELAAKLGSQRNTVYKLVHDARTKLRRGLESKGFTAEHVLALFSEGPTKWH